MIAPSVAPAQEVVDETPTALVNEISPIIIENQIPLS
jgi:hypothetical protein